MDTRLRDPRSFCVTLLVVVFGVYLIRPDREIWLFSESCNSVPDGSVVSKLTFLSVGELILASTMASLLSGSFAPACCA